MSERAARKPHAVLEAQTVMLLAEAVQLAGKYWLTLSVSAVGGNHSRTIPGWDRNMHKTGREKKANMKAQGGVSSNIYANMTLHGD